MIKSIHITREIVNQIISHAMRHAQVEVCGLVAAKGNYPVSVYPIRNCAKDTMVQYEMDPKQLIAAMKRMREQDETLYAIYHSHPGSEPVPSEKDIECAEYPDAYHLIVSLKTQGVLDMHAFHINHGNVTEINIEIE